MITNYVSSKRVISKIMSDLDLAEEAVRISDIVEWIGEAVQEIGSCESFENVRTVSQFSNYSCSIPEFADRVLSIEYSKTGKDGSFVPMTVATGNSIMTTVQEASNRQVSDQDLLRIVKTLYGLTTDAQAYAKLSSDNKIREQIVMMYNNSVYSEDGNGQYVSLSNGPQYKIMNNRIFINLKDGYLRINYRRIMLDEDGYPMIPDMKSWSEAIFWYVESKLLYPDFRRGKNGNAYINAKQSYNFYAKQAYAESIAPNADELESIKHQWLRLIPNISSHDHGFSDLSTKQRYYF